MPASRAPPRGDGGQRYHSGRDPGYRRSYRHGKRRVGKRDRHHATVFSQRLTTWPLRSMKLQEVINKDDVEQNEEKEDSDEEFDSSENEIEESKKEYVPDGENKVPILFTQNGLNNLIRRYAMPKDVSEDLIKKEKKNFGNTTPKIRKPHWCTA
ncbi:hypothetical protein ILUMI_14272 [Ignelater luminosus]|uniref:Uncharacterized protein n=1 Tax=Ignelater luminosus TaxID=2038154 RepID=A0A8K0GAM3_IGNLU|nr:hypothetical protein ILUMI_14272 [Ignelater luminosus]